MHCKTAAPPSTTCTATGLGGYPYRAPRGYYDNTDERYTTSYDLTREVLAQDGRVAELTPGEVVVWDSRRPAQFKVLEALRKRTLFLPRDELEALCPHLDHLTAVGLSRRSPAARLLVAHLDALAAILPTLDGPTIVGARNATLELLGAALRPDATAGGTSLRAGLHALASEHVEHRLGEPALTPESVARALGCIYMNLP